MSNYDILPPAPAPSADFEVTPPDAGFDILPPEVTPAARVNAYKNVGSNLFETLKGVIPGAINTAGTAVEGVGGLLPGREMMAARAPLAERIKAAPSMSPDELQALRTDIQNSGFAAGGDTLQRVLSDVLDGTMPLSEVDAALAPIGPGLVQQGQSIQNASKGVLPAAPGYEQSIGRILGEGLGSLVPAIGAALAGGPLGAGVFAGASGAGEAHQNAAQANATPGQTDQATALGVLPGLTDVLPVERLVGRLLPNDKLLQVAEKYLSPKIVESKIAQVAASLGLTGAMEGTQEGVQQVMQNEIAKEVYKPDQSLTDQVLPNIGAGAGVGVTAEGVKLGLEALLHRRVHGGATPDAPQAADASSGYEIVGPSSPGVPDEPVVSSPPPAQPAPTYTIEPPAAPTSTATHTIEPPAAAPTASVEPPAAAPAPTAPTAPVATPATPDPSVPRAVRRAAELAQSGQSEDITTPEGSMSVPATYEVVDASTLTPASGDLQPRDRTRAASDEQIAKISGGLDPSKVAYHPETDRGAPVVDENGTVLSGNGRFSGILQAAQQNPQAYENYVNQLKGAGFNVDGMSQPVLVRRVRGLDPQQKTAFALKSNANSSMGLAPSEQARIDATVIDDGMLSKLDTDTEKGVASASNNSFVQSYMAKIEANRRSNYVDNKGRLLPAGVDAIHAALFAKAYSDEQLTQRIVEEEQGQPGIRNTLLGAAPAWAQMRSKADPKLDITKNLVDAVQAIGEMRRAKQTPETWLSQMDAFNQPDPTTVELIKAFYNENGTKARAWAKARDFLKSYAQKATDQSNATGDLTGRAVTPQDIINEVKAEQDKESAGLFADKGQSVSVPAETKTTTAEPNVRPGSDRPKPNTAPSGRPNAGLAGLQERTGAVRGDGASASAEATGGAKTVSPGNNQADTANQVASLDPSNDVPEDNTSTAPLEAKRTPRGTFTPVFMDFALSKGDPITDSALALINVDQATAHNMPPKDKLSGLARVLSTFFGFKNISGSRANVLEALDQLKDAYANLQMMANVMGLPIKAMSLNGRIALTLEKFTKRTTYLGLYDPNDHTISLPGRSRSFAHEWMHALDHFLIDTIGPQTKEYMLTRETRKQGLDPASNVHVAFADLMNALFADNAQLSLEVARLQQQASAVNKQGQPTAAAKAAQIKLDNIIKGKGFNGAYSDFAKNAAKYGTMDGQPSYWLDPAEMLARAGEAYVAHKMENAGVDKTNFVSKDDAAYLSNADARLALTFPKAGDRIRIFAAFDTLFQHLQAGQSFGPDAVASAPLLKNDIPNPQEFAPLAAAKAAGRGGLVREVLHEAASSVADIKRLLSGDAAEVGNEFRDELAARVGDQTSGSGMKPRLTGFQRASNAYMALLGTVSGRAKIMWSRQKTEGAKAALRAVSDMMFAESGTGRSIREPFGAAVRGKTRARFSQVSNILKTYGIPEEVAPNPKSKKGIAAVEQRNRLRRLLTLQSGEDPAAVAQQIGASQQEVETAAALRKFMDKVYRDTTESGVDMGYVTDSSYLTRILNENVVLDDPNGFVSAASQVYDVVFDKGFADDPHDMIVEALQFIRGVDRQRTSAVAKQISDYNKARRALAKAQANNDPNLQQFIDNHDKAQQDLADDLKPIWSDLSAELWKERVAIGNGLQFTQPIGPNARPMKSRTLPPEADRLLEKYYLSDPVDAISSYVHQVTRKSEFTRRFGNPAGATDFRSLAQNDKGIKAAMIHAGLSLNNPTHRVRAIMELTNPKTANRVEMLMREAERAGAIPEDIRGMGALVDYITGRADDGMPQAAHAVAVGMSVYGQLALMGRSMWASIPELTTMVARTRDTHATLSTLATYFKHIVGGQDIRDLKALAQHIGVITTSLQEAAIRSMNDGLTNMPVSANKLLSKFYDRNLLTGLTNAQRTSAIKGYHIWLTRLLDNAVNGKGMDQAKAKADLRELGFKDNEIQSVHDWVQQQGGSLPTTQETEDPIGQLWAAGARRFVDEVVQEGQKELKPQTATTTLGRLSFGLTTFLYSFQRNVHQRLWNMMQRDYNLRLGEGQGPTEAKFKTGAEFAGRVAVAFSAMYVGQLLTTLLRELIFNHEQWKRHEEDGDVVSWLLSLTASRTGLTGAFDPIYQAISSVKYQRDLTSITAGAYMSIPLGFLQSGLQLGFKNSGKTNTAEYAFTKNMYQAFAAPLISAAASAIPGGKLVDAAAAGAIMWGTSNQAADSATKALLGESDAAKRKREQNQHARDKANGGNLGNLGNLGSMGSMGNLGKL